MRISREAIVGRGGREVEDGNGEGSGEGNCEKQEAGSRNCKEAGFRVQERLVRSPSFPRKRESMLAPD
jgi:hypothetical protein